MMRALVTGATSGLGREAAIQLGRRGWRVAISGRRRPLTDGELLKAFAAHPLMTLKVVAAIHWHALRLWRKGARFQRDPAKARRPKSAEEAGTP